MPAENAEQIRSITDALRGDDSELKKRKKLPRSTRRICYFYRTDNNDIIQEKIKYEDIKFISLMEKDTGMHHLDLLEIVTCDDKNHICARVYTHDKLGFEYYGGITGGHGYDIDNDSLHIKQFLENIIEIKKYV